MFHLAKDKRHRVWLHTLVEHFMRRDYNLPRSNSFKPDGLETLHSIVSNMQKKQSICFQDFSTGLKNMVKIIDDELEKSTWSGRLDLPREGTVGFVSCASLYLVPLVMVVVGGG